MKASKDAIGSVPLESITKIDWRKTGLPTEARVRNVALICLAVGTTRQVRQDVLASETKLSVNTVWLAIKDARALGVLQLELVNTAGRRRPSIYRVDWKRFRAYWGKANASELSLMRSIPFHERRPSEERLSTEQREILIAADAHWKRLGFKSYADWLRAKAVFAAIGGPRKVSTRELAREFPDTSSYVIKTTVRAARDAGVLSVARNFENGRAGAKSVYQVCWDKIRAAAGENHAAVAINSSPAKHATATASRPVDPPQPLKGGRPKTAIGFLPWLRETMPEHPDWGPAHFREAYKASFPSMPVPKKATSRVQVFRVRDELSSAQGVTKPM